MFLQEKIEKMRSLPGREAAAFNWVLHYLSVNGHLPKGWEMVWGTPRYTGRSSPKVKLAKTAVSWRSLKNESTRSPDVNPEVLDINPIPTPKTGGTRKIQTRPFRANLTSGNRTKTHHEVMKPHTPCGEVYNPACRDLEWEMPIWIGGADWAQRPLYRHEPPDVRETFAQDPSGQIPKDTPFGHSPPGFIPPDVAVAEQPEHAAQMDTGAAAFSGVVDEALGLKWSAEAPAGLLSKISSTTKSAVSSLKNAWLSLAKSRSQSQSATRSSLMIGRRRKKHDSSDGPRIFAMKHKPGTAEHDAALYRQAIEIRRMTKKPMYIVDYNGRRYTSSHPQKHGKIIHVIEATTSASFPTQTTSGTTFYGRRGLATIEKERKKRMKRQSSSKCGVYDPKCRDKEWEVPAQTGGVALPLLKRSSIIS